MPKPNHNPIISSLPSLVRKRAGGARLWMRIDRFGRSEMFECDKTVIINRVSIPPRDFRILGPIFSHSSTILARERAMIVNLEFVKAIVTAEEVLLLDPIRREVLPFVDQLRRHLPQALIPPESRNSNGIAEQQLPQGCWPDELPFEFRVLEIALEVVCSFLESSVSELEADAYPALDHLALSISTKNLEHVCTLKSNLTRLLARVQKVRDEIEQLLDDDQDMAQLYLTRKSVQNQQAGAGPPSSQLRRFGSNRSDSLASNHPNGDDVEDLEMLLEAYFMQLDGTRNKILSVREYIDDTEDYVNIQLDSHRNQLIQFQLMITIVSFAISAETLVTGIMGMNIPCTLYHERGIFGQFVGWMTAATVALFALVLGYARWKKLIGS